MWYPILITSIFKIHSKIIIWIWVSLHIQILTDSHHNIASHSHYIHTFHDTILIFKCLGPTTFTIPFYQYFMIPFSYFIHSLCHYTILIFHPVQNSSNVTKKTKKGVEHHPTTKGIFHDILFPTDIFEAWWCETNPLKSWDINPKPCMMYPKLL